MRNGALFAELDAGAVQTRSAGRRGGLDCRRAGAGGRRKSRIGGIGARITMQIGGQGRRHVGAGRTAVIALVGELCRRWERVGGAGERPRVGLERLGWFGGRHVVLAGLGGRVADDENTPLAWFLGEGRASVVGHGDGRAGRGEERDGEGGEGASGAITGDDCGGREEEEKRERGERDPPGTPAAGRGH